MHIAYNALRNAASPCETPFKTESELRAEGYQMACSKLSKEIAAIQRHIPGWRPAFHYNHNTQPLTIVNHN